MLSRSLVFLVSLAAARCLEGADARGVRLLTGCGPPPPLAAMNAPAVVGAGSPNRLASVADITGATYAWTITNGTITSGQGTAQVSFTAGTAGVLLHIAVDITQDGCPFGGGFADVTVAPSGEAVQFYSVPPCRLIDTRGPDGPALGPAGSPDRRFTTAAACGMPGGVTAVSANLTVVNPSAPGSIVIYPLGGSPAGTTMLSFGAGQTRAGNAIFGTAMDGIGTFLVNNSSAGPLDFVLDVNGYFE